MSGRGLGEGLCVGGIDLGLFAALECRLRRVGIGELGDCAGVEGRVALDVDREGRQGLLGGLVRGRLSEAVGVVSLESGRERLPRAVAFVRAGFPRSLGRQ